jgi:hypothetical protein
MLQKFLREYLETKKRAALKIVLTNIRIKAEIIPAKLTFEVKVC